MDTADRIVQVLEERRNASGAAIAAALGISRQAAHRHLGRLLEEGRLQRRGRTRGVLYSLPSKRRKAAEGPSVRYNRAFRLAGLQEDAVFAEVSLGLDLKRRLSKAAHDIARYAFTEMLNNAVEHSHSTICRVRVTLAARQMRAVIRDEGIGAFHSIAQRMSLRDENEAVGELLKGKATSMPDRHSGEGIFFTSRACDLFALRSHRIELTVTGPAHEAAVSLKRYIRGTEVTMHISRAARRRLADVFAQFAPEEYEFRFERSVVTVKFAARDYVSRSEAKRLLARLDTFREVLLDFAGVRSLGQGFADEVFRVFPAAHPQTKLEWVNVAAPLEALIRHVADNRR